MWLRQHSKMQYFQNGFYKSDRLFGRNNGLFAGSLPLFIPNVKIKSKMAGKDMNLSEETTICEHLAQRFIQIFLRIRNDENYVLEL